MTRPPFPSRSDLATYRELVDALLVDGAADLARAFAKEIGLANVNRLRSAKRRPRSCMIPGCDRRTVRSSHTIAKTSSLSLIAENGHVITPIGKLPAQRLEASLVGIHRATTFAGFCPTHELLFQSFEMKGQLESRSDIALQFFRSVCREMVRMEVELEHVKRWRCDWHEFRRVTFERSLREALGLADLRLNRINASSDLDATFDELIDRWTRGLQWLHEKMYPEALGALTSPETYFVRGAVVAIDAMVPVCLSGSGIFHVLDGGCPREVQALMTVAPTAHGTVTILAGAAEDKIPLRSYARQNFSTVWSLLDCIESWMVFGTDHWFLSPKLWNHLSSDLQWTFLNEVKETRADLSHLCSIPILNPTRRNLLEALELHPETDPNEVATIRNRLANRLQIC